MKLVMDEKLKHRLIGLAVIISLGAIFAPAVMKKSSQHLDRNFSVNVKLPPKPVAPDVVLTNEKELFQTIKIAKPQIPAVTEQRQLTELVRAEPVKSDHTQNQAVASVAEKEIQVQPMHLALNEAAKGTAKKIINNTAIKNIKAQTTVALRQKSTP